MSVVAALIDGNGKIIMGADRQSTAGHLSTTRKTAKIFTLGDMAVGMVGYSAHSNWIRRGFDPPKRYQDESIEDYMITRFAGAFRDAMKGQEWTEVEDGSRCWAGQCLIAVEGRVFLLEGSFGICESDDLWGATGSGQEYAYGSFFSTASVKSLSGKQKVTRALEAAAKYNPYVCGPFDYLEV